MSKLIGLIPARGGSERIPGKNLKDLDHHSLVWHAVTKMQLSGVTSGDPVWVSTDDDAIAAEAEAVGAAVIRRPPELAGRSTPMIDVVEHALGLLPEAEGVLLHQCTSPFTSVDDLRAVAEMLNVADYVTTVVHDSGVVHAKSVRPFWARGTRSRFLGWRETGGAYAIRREAIRMVRDREEVRVLTRIQHAGQAVDIDWPWQLEIARALWPVMRYRVYGAAEMPASA